MVTPPPCGARLLSSCINSSSARWILLQGTCEQVGRLCPSRLRQEPDLQLCSDSQARPPDLTIALSFPNTSRAQLNGGPKANDHPLYWLSPDAAITHGHCNFLLLLYPDRRDVSSSSHSICPSAGGGRRTNSRNCDRRNRSSSSGSHSTVHANLFRAGARSNQRLRRRILFAQSSCGSLSAQSHKSGIRNLQPVGHRD